LEITEVHVRPAGESRFAAINPDDWEEVARLRHSAGLDDGADFSYVTYHRRKSH
jgi:dihydrofolate reductase